MKKLFLPIVLLSALFFSACSDISTDSPQPREKAYLSVSVNDMAAARGISPVNVTEADISLVELLYKSTGSTSEMEELAKWEAEFVTDDDTGGQIIKKNAIEVMKEATASTSENPLVLDTGTYDFTLNLYVQNFDNPPSAATMLTQTGSVTAKEIKTGSNSLAFSTKYYTGEVSVSSGMGLADITLTWNADKRVSFVKAGLFAFDSTTLRIGEAVEGCELEALIVTEVDSTTKSATYTKAVPLGRYYITFYLYQDESDDEPTGTWSESITIVSGAKTVATKQLSTINTKFSVSYKTPVSGSTEWDDVSGEWQNNFEPETSRNANMGIVLPTANNIAKDGYEFAGWYESADLSGDPIETIGTGDSTAKDYVLYAKWHQVGPVEFTASITVKQDDVTVTNNLAELDGTTLEFIASEDYTSYTWKIDGVVQPSLDGQFQAEIDAAQWATGVYDISLVVTDSAGNYYSYLAQVTWTRTYTITFVEEDDTFEQYVTEGNKIDEPTETPTYGWYADSEYKIPFNFATAPAPTSSLTIYGLNNLTTIYVSADAEEGEGIGTFAAPLDTIANAAMLMLDEDVDYTVKIIGKLETKQTIDSSAEAKAKSITIMGANALKNGVPQDGIQPSGANADGLVVQTTAPVTLKNLFISGGYHGLFLGNEAGGIAANAVLESGVLLSENEIGAYVCSDTTLRVKSGVVIKDNTSSETVAGIYVDGSASKGGTLYLEGGTFSGNKFTGTGAYDRLLQDIYLYDGNDSTAKIYISAVLTESAPIAMIQCSDLGLNEQILYNDNLSEEDFAAQCAKFTIYDYSRAKALKIDGTGSVVVDALTTIYVSETGDNSSGRGTSAFPFATIGKALDYIVAAEDGKDYVIKIDGTLTGAQTLPENHESDSNNDPDPDDPTGDPDPSDPNEPETYANSITLMGANALVNGVPQDTLDGIIDGDRSDYTLTVETGVPVIVQNLKITNGKTGVYIPETAIGAKITLGEGCLVTGNGNNSGVWINANATVTLDGGSITGNAAGAEGTSNGGGVLVQGGGTFVMKSGTISGSNAAANWGGGVSVEADCEFTMSGGTISGNTAGQYGGGVYVDAGAIFTMTGGTISGNTVESGGKGSGVYVVEGATFTMGGSAVVASSNDVYLANHEGNYAVISIASELTGTSPVATITPSEYTTDRPLLALAKDYNGADITTTTIAKEYGKFAVTPMEDAATGTTKPCQVTNEGKLLLSVDVAAIVNQIEGIQESGKSGTITLAGLLDIDGLTTIAAKIKEYSPRSTDSVPTVFFTLDMSGVVGMTEFCQSQFTDIKNLKAVTPPAGMTSIAVRAFSGCNYLETVTIPTGVTTIGWGAFSNCYKLAALDLPGTVTLIDSDAFYGCEALTSVVIPEGVTKINSSAFQRCYALETVTLPSTLTSFGSNVFIECKAFKAITVSEGNLKFSSQDGVLYNNTKTKLLVYPAAKEDSSFTIPSTVTRIDDDAFYGCEALTSVVIPEGVTEIGSYAFYNCEKLASADLPDSVTTIELYAFAGCAFSSVNISQYVTFLDTGAFRANINNGTMTSTSNLTAINVHADNPNYASEDGVLYELHDNKKTTILQYPAGNEAVSFTIPSSVTTIRKYAFNGCIYLKSVVIPDGVTIIPQDAFSVSKALETIDLPASVTEIDSSAANNCTKLTKINYRGTEAQKADIKIYDNTFATATWVYNYAMPTAETMTDICTRITETLSGKSITSFAKSAAAPTSTQLNTMVDVFGEQYSLDGKTIEDGGQIPIWYEENSSELTLYYYIPDGYCLLLNADSSGLFAGNTNFKTIDVSDFNVSQVTNMSNMFGGLTDLTTIYAKADTDWSTAVPADCNSENMFPSCELNGGASDGLDISKAFVGTKDDVTGYFTAKE